MESTNVRSPLPLPPQQQQAQQQQQRGKYVIDTKPNRYNNLGFVNESPHGGHSTTTNTNTPPRGLLGGIGGGENDGIIMANSDHSANNSNSRRSKNQSQIQMGNYTPSPTSNNINTHSHNNSNSNSNTTNSNSNNESTLSVTNMNNFNNSNNISNLNNCSFSSTAVNMNMTMNMTNNSNSMSNSITNSNSVNHHRTNNNNKILQQQLQIQQQQQLHLQQNHGNQHVKMGNRLTMIYSGHVDNGHPYMGNFHPPETIHPGLHSPELAMNMNMNMPPDMENDPSGGQLGQDFLPICDSLFNVISLAAYFCDIVFDVLTAYTFYKDEMTLWSILCMIFISVSTILSQVLSLKWYRQSGLYRSKQQQHSPGPGDPVSFCASSNIVLAMHLSLCGVIWRYFKLFIPVDLRYVKNEVRDLCLIRLVHAFCEAAPMLLIQLYLIWLKPGPDYTTDLNIVSTALSLFSVCWALASFSKNIRRQNVHKFVLTWLGVIFQFLWRLGTVTARVIALTVYATIYSYWLFLVIFLHWFSMLLWLISPKNIFHGEKMSTLKKVWYSTLIAVVYVFCYVNVQESNSRQKLIIFYVTMFLENSLLYGVWLIAVRNEEFWFKDLATSLVFAGFFVGISFMCLYYRYFHPTKLSYADESGTTSTYRDSRSSSIGIGNGNGYGNPIHGKQGNNEHIFKCPGSNNNKCTVLTNGNINGANNNNINRNHNSNGLIHGAGGGRNMVYNKMNGGHHHPNHQIRGVFNCQFHPAMKRKKKKPTSFIPPPAVHNSGGKEKGNKKDNKNDPNSNPDLDQDPDLENELELENGHDIEDNSPNNSFLISPNNKTHPMMSLMMNMNGKMANPFWKRPLSITMGSENEGSVGSRVDIQQKLQEKKQQQLAELREIEEEIKQGKLKRPHMSEIPEPVSERQPIPFEKKQPWSRADPPVQLSPRPPIIIPPQSDPNEFVLDPAYLMYSAVGAAGVGGFYEQPDWNYYEPIYQNTNDTEIQRGMRKGGSNGNPHVNSNSNLNLSMNPNPHSNSNSNINLNPNPNSHQNPSLNPRDSIYKSYRIPSDIDSQMSLPRSYTLPREFKYKRKLRKPVKTENFLPSTNSSDADVDSGEEDPEIYSHLRPYPLPSIQQVHMPNSGPNSGTGTGSGPGTGTGQGKRYVGSRRRLHVETKL